MDLPEIVFEDEYCIVFNKRAGLAAQGGAKITNSLDSILKKNYKNAPLLVHRLDKETSGLILTAKTKEYAGYFSKIFSSRAAGKFYQAVCIRSLNDKVIRSGGASVLRKSGFIKNTLNVKGAEKEARTAYKLLKEFKFEVPGFPALSLFLLEIKPDTGRFHQIRRSFAALGFPLLGDDKYGDFVLNRAFYKASHVKNLFLHSARLTLPLPDGRTLDVHAPPPEYWRMAQSAAPH